MRKLKTGCIHIYTGDGKGKTTASLGIALRAASSGLGVCMFQFLKAHGTSSESWLEFPNFRVVCLGQAHPMFGGSKEKLSSGIRKELAKIKRVMKAKKYDVIILDEVINCVSEGFVKAADLLDLIRSRPKKLELILTGRGAPKELVEAADYVTKLEKVKHPFDNGLHCRKGIEY
ncbi:MAG: cob(I)yrinic acid a,c-diamide adenosyltransferase [Candidatus Omnitrophica bacterium]|nr:cob(I)yrinic acid a,c-diamide adenosyltransferase [Candidatus Omnitrophota bacterium]